MRMLLFVALVGCSGSEVSPDAAPHDCEDLATQCTAISSSDVSALIDTSLVAECLAVSHAGDASACRSRVDCHDECAPTSAPAVENRLVGCWRDHAISRTVSFGPTNVHEYQWSDTSEMYASLYSIHGDEGEPDVMTLYSFMGANACYRVAVRGTQMFLSERRLIGTDTCTQEVGIQFIVNSPRTPISASRWDLVSAGACP